MSTRNFDTSSSTGSCDWAYPNCLYTKLMDLLNEELKHGFEERSKIALNFVKVATISLAISELGCNLLYHTSFRLLKLGLTLLKKTSQHKGIIRWSYKLISFMLLMMNFTIVYSINATIVTPPQSVFTNLAAHSVQMSCEVEADTVSFSVNNENADQDSVRDMGIFVGMVQSDGGFSSLTLTITVNEALNNTMVQCVAVNVIDNLSSSISDPAFLIIEGRLPQPKNLSVSLNNQSISSSELLVTWSAPPTLFNTTLNGYNISSSLPETEGPSFTTETQIVYKITNIDPCKEINITVTPFNGLEGDPAEVNEIYLPSQSSNIPTELFVNVSDLGKDSNRVQIIILIDIMHLCPGTVPTHIKVVVQVATEKLLVNEYDSELRSSEEDNKLISIKEIKLNKSTKYKATVEFTNRFGLAGFSQSFNFTLNDIQPVPTTSTDKPMSVEVLVSSIEIALIMLMIVAVIALFIYRKAILKRRAVRTQQRLQN